MASSAESLSLLAVRNLRVEFPVRGGWIRAVDGADLAVNAGERVGLVGESGSGKSVTALAIVGLARSARVSGEIWFRGSNLLASRRVDWRKIRGSQIGLVFQDPLSSLNPVMRIGEQVAEALRVHGVSRSDAKQEAVRLLDRVGIPNASRRYGDFPHQFSGGMRQRVVIAIALASRPQLLIADEPTTALDVLVQAQVLDLLDELSIERRMALLLITHDLSVVAGRTQRVVVMYAGRAVEESPVDNFFYSSTMPYTWGLIGSVPSVERDPTRELSTIGGQPPTPSRRPAGCSFHPRCAYVADRCRVEVPEFIVHEHDDHRSACHFAGDLSRPSFLPQWPSAVGE